MPESRIIPIPEYDDMWTKAAVLGGIWASFEIVIGSFLHNLHLPFSGSILTFFATILMIAFYQVWPEKGLIWRAGLICALMKSISPSGVILGPMTGIFMEALMVDLFLRFPGNNPAGLILAGIFSQLSALIHKAASLLIRYGNDIVRIYENIFEFALRHFKNLDLTPIQAILALVIIYASLGSLASLIGYRMAKTNSGGKRRTTIKPRKLKPDSSWDAVSPNQRFHSSLLVIHMLVLPAILFMYNRLGMHPLTLSLSISYIIFCLLWYRRIKYRLFKPFFLIHLLVIGALAGLFWDSPGSAGPSSSLAGWIIALSLILRAFLVITGFSALSTELRNPRLKIFLFKFGFKKAYHAVSMAFSALPLMLDHGVSGKAFLANPFRALRQTIMDADEWLYVLQQKNEQK